MQRNDMQQIFDDRQKEFQKFLLHDDEKRYKKLKELRALALQASRPIKMYDKQLEEIRKKWPRHHWN